MGRTSGLSEAQRRALARLKKIPALADFYLAGGTAIAVHLGHRRSKDLDLFSRKPRASLARVRRAGGKAIGEVLSTTDAVLRVRIEGTPVSYPYPPLELVPGPGGFPLASLRDLAAMKLAAIAKRGLRRDFWDLYAILESGLALRDAGRAYLQRFSVEESDLYHVARALTWFADADAENVWPPGLTPARWRRIKSFFEKGTHQLLGEP